MQLDLDAVRVAGDGLDHGVVEHLGGEVVERLYRGSVAEYQLDCAGERVTVLCHNRGQALYGIGERVLLGVASADVVLLGG